MANPCAAQWLQIALQGPVSQAVLAALAFAEEKGATAKPTAMWVAAAARGAALGSSDGQAPGRGEPIASLQGILHMWGGNGAAAYTRPAQAG